MTQNIFAKMDELFHDIHHLLSEDNGLGSYGSLSFTKSRITVTSGDNYNVNSTTLKKILSQYSPTQDYASEIVLGICATIFQDYNFRKPYFYGIGIQNPLSYSFQQSRAAHKYFFDIIFDLHKDSTTEHYYCLEFCKLYLANKLSFPEKWKHSLENEIQAWRFKEFFVENKHITNYGFFEKPETLISIMKYKDHPKRQDKFESDLIMYAERAHLLSQLGTSELKRTSNTEHTVL